MSPKSAIADFSDKIDILGSGNDFAEIRFPQFLDFRSFFLQTNIVYSGQFSVTSEGTKYVRFYSVDRTPNRETAKSQAIKLDRTTPTSTITSPADNWRNSDLFIQTSDSDTGGSGLRWFI